MLLKSLRPFECFWYGDNSKVNNNRARGIYDRVQAPASAMRELGGQSAEAGPSWFCTATWYSVSSRLNDAKNVALLDRRKIRKCYFHGIVVALGQREFKLLSDPGTAAHGCEPQPDNMVPTSARA